MGILKKLELSYRARLKNIRLINFSVDQGELYQYMPRLPLFHFRGKPIVSFLDVCIYHLEPSFFKYLHLSYRHLAFRVLINDGFLHSDGINRGIFYVHSFAEQRFIVNAGRLLTNFNFHRGCFISDEGKFSVRCENKFLSYHIDAEKGKYENEELRQTLMHIDRAYSCSGKRVKCTKVNRFSFPLKEISCDYFDTNFFNSAELLCAHAIDEILDYEWLPAQTINFSTPGPVFLHRSSEMVR